MAALAWTACDTTLSHDVLGGVGVLPNELPDDLLVIGDGLSLCGNRGQVRDCGFARPETKGRHSCFANRISGHGRDVHMKARVSVDELFGMAQDRPLTIQKHVMPRTPSASTNSAAFRTMLHSKICRASSI